MYMRARALCLQCFTHLFYTIQMTCTYKPMSLVLIQDILAALLHGGRQQKRPEFPKHHGPILQRTIDSTQPGQSHRIESQLENTKVSEPIKRLRLTPWIKHKVTSSSSCTASPNRQGDSDLGTGANHRQIDIGMLKVQLHSTILKDVMIRNK